MPSGSKSRKVSELWKSYESESTYPGPNVSGKRPRGTREDRDAPLVAAGAARKARHRHPRADARSALRLRGICQLNRGDGSSGGIVRGEAQGL
eukprot:13870115-Alexandrium_andersonii.AAC.1